MAIINSAYGKVKEEKDQSGPEFMISDYVKKKYATVVDKLNLKRNRIIDIQDILRSEQISNKEELEFNVWRRELKKKGYADMEIEAIFSKYDQDCDRKLNELEKVRLEKDVTKARNELSEELKNFKSEQKVSNKKDAFE